RREQLALRAFGRLPRPPQRPATLGGQLDAVAASIGRIGRASQEPALLELIEDRDQVARLDSQGQREVALRNRPLRIEVVENGELGPAQAAVREASAKPPGRCTGEAEEQQTEPRV